MYYDTHFPPCHWDKTQWRLAVREGWRCPADHDSHVELRSAVGFCGCFWIEEAIQPSSCPQFDVTIMVCRTSPALLPPEPPAPPPNLLIRRRWEEISVAFWRFMALQLCAASGARGYSGFRGARGKRTSCMSCMSCMSWSSKRSWGVKVVVEVTEVKKIVEVVRACLGPGGEDQISNVMFTLKSHILPLQYSNYTHGATSVSS